MGNKVKILYFDIETLPMLVYLYDLRVRSGYVSHENIYKDWSILSWAAKWDGDPAIMYMDQKDEPDINNDKRILDGMWNLLNEADVIVTQNGKRFDVKKLNARFKIHKIQPPSAVEHHDTKQIASKYFGFTSNSLAYLCKALGLQHRKSRHELFPGGELQRACYRREPGSFEELEKYNCLDVLATEELWKELRPWDGKFNPNIYNDEDTANECQCGGTMWVKDGFAYRDTGKFQKYRCKHCGTPKRDRQNQFSELKRLNLKAKV